MEINNEFNKNKFISRLLELRNEAGHSRPDLAKLLNKSSGSVAHYELGNREPNLSTLHSMAAIYNVSTDYILGISDIRNIEQNFEYILEVFKKNGLISGSELVATDIDAFIKQKNFFSGLDQQLNDFYNNK